MINYQLVVKIPPEQYWIVPKEIIFYDGTDVVLINRVIVIYKNTMNISTSFGQDKTTLYLGFSAMLTDEYTLIYIAYQLQTRLNESIPATDYNIICINYSATVQAEESQNVSTAASS